MENLARGKRIILGIHPETHTRRYLVHKAEEYRLANSGLYAVHDNLEDCIKELKERIKSDLETTDRSVNTFFTSDTHFGSERTLELSVRPFKNVEEMDWTMIERWNQVVRPNSKVYHLGDFGNLDMVKYLNGQILLVLGNYEKKDIQEKYDGDIKKYGEVLCEKGFNQFSDEPFETDLYTSFEDSQKITLGHEPIATNNARLKFGTKYALFGHIHGLQKIKPFGINIGVDCNNFTPCRASKEVRFFLNALDEGFDEEVWIQ
jgi:calcineurin-like phosphoesterase family protein